MMMAQPIPKPYSYIPTIYGDYNKFKHLLVDQSKINRVIVTFNPHRDVFVINSYYDNSLDLNGYNLIFTETINCRGDERLETLKDLFMSQDVANYIIAKNMLLYGK